MSIQPMKTLCKVSAGSDEYFLLTTIHQDRDGDVESFDLAITDGTCAWCGSVSQDEMERTARKMKMGYTDYVDQCRKALSRRNMGSFSFLYETKMKQDDIHFVWKKHMASDNIKVQLGSLTLRESEEPSKVLKHVLESTIGATSILEEQITSLSSDNMRLASERATALKRLDKCVVAKEELESDLYSKFVTVLNDKKVKLRELKQELNQILADGPANNEPEPSTSRKRKKEVPLSDGDSSVEDGDNDMLASDYNTDDEDEKPVKKEVVVLARSPTKDSSLLLDDGLDHDDDEKLIITKRRRRGGATSKKQTPSKPVLPKVTSSVEKLRTSSRGSLRKSSSNASKSSDNIETDDLFDNL